jgi:hypothetical protein
LTNKLTSCFERGLKLTFIGVHVNTENNQAAQVDPLDAFVQEAIDQDSEEIKVDTPPTESATVEDAIIEPAPAEAEKPTGDGFQKRIDKVTADKYAEKRRADDLQKKIDLLEASTKETLQKPKLEDHDYDEDEYNKATRDFEINQGVQSALDKRTADAKAEQQKAESEKVTANFNERAAALGKSDFDEKANSIPNLPVGVADAIMQSEDGADIVYYLGSPENAEKANALASMTPAMAIMELGKLSAQLSTKPEIKLSAAPDPIDPVKAGSSLSSNIDDDMSMDEWMKKYG